MEDKKTTLGLLESTLYNFNCAKIDNKFKSADDFLNFLLALLVKIEEKEEEATLKPLDNHTETTTFIKENVL